MKLFSLLCATLFMYAFSFQALAQNQKLKVKDKGEVNSKTDKNLPYTAYYSSHFEMGNPHYAAQVLDVWKEYDNNSWDHLGNLLADTVTAILMDGTVIKGKENFLSAIKAYRGSFPTAKSDVAAWLVVNSIDQKKQTVCIWGDETDTKSDGTKQSVSLHELWFFNKDGKVDLLRQFIEQTPHGAQ